MSRRKKELNVTINEFDPKRQIKHGKNVLIIGSADSGKSHLLKYLLSLVKVPFAVLVDPNEFATGFYGKILPKQCKLDELTDSNLSKVVERQKTLCEFISEHPNYEIDHDACLVMDSCEPDFIDLKWAKNPNFKFLFRSGKKAHINMYFTSNYPIPIPAHYLAAIDYVFILNETIPKNKRALWSMFGGMFPEYKQFDQALQAICSGRYNAMVIDRTRMSNRIDEQVYYYKAPKRIEKFYLGSKNLYKMCWKTDLTFHDLMDNPIDLFRNHEKPSY